MSIKLREKYRLILFVTIVKISKYLEIESSTTLIIVTKLGSRANSGNLGMVQYYKIYYFGHISIKEGVIESFLKILKQHLLMMIDI